MEVITIESAVWQQLQDRIERIEKYVKDATETVCIGDEEIFLNNDQACRLLCVEKRTMQYYRSEGKIAYSLHGKQLHYRLSDIEEFAHVTMRPLSKKLLASIRKECIEENKNIIGNYKD
ncbi:MAG: helix-turn-helix domain-containing protein [Prevotella sp.]|nr:helix-turn-helix domain-containing protein [Prevotella sp.]MBQ5494092.1 helix-turn-helix domain-containing protein [Prevotella sp.]